MQGYLIIGVFGLIGIWTRYAIDRVIGNDLEVFPVSTFLINVIGSFLAGIIYALGERQILPPIFQTSLIVGFCGGFTTFSAYTLQSFLMLNREKTFFALIYLITSPVLGLVAACIPIILIRKFQA